jgi:hypothetical protein
MWFYNRAYRSRADDTFEQARGNIIKQNFWEELIAYFSFYDTYRIENERIGEIDTQRPVA